MSLPFLKVWVISGGYLTATMAIFLATSKKWNVMTGWLSNINSLRHTKMPNPFDAVMFVLLVISALQGMGWLPW